MFDLLIHRKNIIITTSFCLYFSRKQEMGLFIAPDEDGTAKGILFWDDGVSFGNMLF